MARRHRAALIAGLTLSVVALLPPVIALADQRLSLHMLQQMLLLAVVIPLVAYGTAALVPFAASRVFHPLAGIVTLNVVLFTWQTPAVMDAAAHDLALRELGQLVFMAGALVFWWPIVRSASAPGGLSPIAKIGYLMVAGVPPTIPGITLAFSNHLFYQAYRSLGDQQIAGLLLFGTAKLALVAGTFVILWRLLTPDVEPPDDDHWHDADADLPPSAPAWYRRLDGELSDEPQPRERVPVGDSIRPYTRGQG
jgi:putative membrane protein